MELFDLIYLITGAVCLYLIWRARSTGELSHLKIFLPSNVTAENCKDSSGFIRAVFPSLLVLGLALIFTGLICLAPNYGMTLPGSLSIVGYVLIVAALVWFVMAERKAVAKYW